VRMLDSVFSVGSFLSICIKPTKVAQPVPAESCALQVSRPAVVQSLLGKLTSATLCAVPCVESPASSSSCRCCCMIDSPTPAPLAHFQRSWARARTVQNMASPAPQDYLANFAGLRGSKADVLTAQTTEMCTCTRSLSFLSKCDVMNEHCT